MNDNGLRILASVGLTMGGVFGMAGTFAPSASLRGLAWGIDGVGLVMAGAVLTLVFYRKGQDLVAAGFLVFAVGEGIILSGAAMDLTASVPSFGAGTSLWALALMLISIPRVFPLPVRLLGSFAAVLFAVTAVLIFAGVQIMPDDIPVAVLRISSARSNAGRLDLDTNNRLEWTGMNQPTSAIGTGWERTPGTRRSGRRGRRSGKRSERGGGYDFSARRSSFQSV